MSHFCTIFGFFMGTKWLCAFFKTNVQNFYNIYNLHYSDKLCNI